VRYKPVDRVRLLGTIFRRQAGKTVYWEPNPVYWEPNPVYWEPNPVYWEPRGSVNKLKTKEKKAMKEA